MATQANWVAYQTIVVKEIEHVKKHLDSKGVTTSDVHDLGGVKYVYFSDPDGNTWALQEIDQGTRLTT